MGGVDAHVLRDGRYRPSGDLRTSENVASLLEVGFGDNWECVAGPFAGRSFLIVCQVSPLFRDPSRCLPRIPAQHLPSALGAQVECAHSRLEGLLPPRAASLRALPWGLGTEWAAPIPWAQQWPGGGPEHHRLAPPPFQGQAEAPVPAAGMWAHCPALFGTHEARVGASGPHIAASCGKDRARVPSAGSTGEGE